MKQYRNLKQEHEEELRKKMEKKTEKHNIETKKVVLEMIDVLPSHDIKPPDNIIFVCQLNKRTLEEDLVVIFSQFGKIKKCDLVKDWKTGESLQYAFIEFEAKRAAEIAFLKMQNALIDNKRIHVDFSQSINKMWNTYNTHRKKKREFFREIRGVNKVKNRRDREEISLKKNYIDNGKKDLVFREKKIRKRLKELKNKFDSSSESC